MENDVVAKRCFTVLLNTGTAYNNIAEQLSLFYAVVDSKLMTELDQTRLVIETAVDADRVIGAWLLLGVCGVDKTEMRKLGEEFMKANELEFMKTKFPEVWTSQEVFNAEVNSVN